MGLWEFFNTTAGGASILGGILAIAGWLSHRDTKQILARMDRESKAYHQVSQAMLSKMDEKHAALLREMEQANEQRAAQLRGLLQ